MQSVMWIGKAVNSSHPTTPILGGSVDHGFRYSPAPVSNGNRAPQAWTGGFGPTNLSNLEISRTLPPARGEQLAAGSTPAGGVHWIREQISHDRFLSLKF